MYQLLNIQCTRAVLQRVMLVFLRKEHKRANKESDYEQRQIQYTGRTKKITG